MSVITFENKPRSVVGLCSVSDSWVRDLNLEAFKVIHEMHGSFTAVRTFGADYGRDHVPHLLGDALLMYDTGIRLLDYGSHKKLRRAKRMGII